MKEKLIRDDMKEMVSGSYETHISEGERYDQLLIAKLLEEVQELTDELESDNLSQRRITYEIADVLEVLEAIKLQYDINDTEVKVAMQDKYKERGGFCKGLTITL